ncbi:MAG: S-adenosylmethionine decarboxylase [Spirochaetes bacterium]|nr:S-adenosylmethionine decarboxylase [Spirochaetota bacterium]
MLSAITRSEARSKEISPIDEFDHNKAWGLYTSVDIHNCHPDYIRDKELIQQYVLQLSEILRMKCFGATQFSNMGSDTKCEGCSMTQFVDSSLVSGRFAYKSNTAYIDIFSCKYYDPEVISHFTLSYFKGSDYSLNVTVRK